MKQIANSLLSERRVEVIRHVLQESQNKVLVMIYSFSDNFDINPILLGLDKPKSKIIAVHHVKGGKSKKIAPADKFETSLAKILRNFDYEIMKVDTDELTDTVLQKLGETVGTETPARPETRWRDNINAWGLSLSAPVRSLLELELVRSTTYVGRLKLYARRLRKQISKIEDDSFLMASLNMLAESYTRLRDYREAEYHLERLGYLAKKYGGQAKFAFYVAMGDLDSDRYNLSQSRGCYRKAHELAVSIWRPDNVILALKDLANLELKKGEYESSLKLANEASFIAEQNGMQIESNPYQDVGAAIFYEGSVEEAIKLRELALENANILSQKQVESINSTALCHLYLWRHKPPSGDDFDRSLRIGLKGLKLAKEVGDPSGVAAAHLNLANCYFFQYKFKRAFWHLAISFIQAIFLEDCEISAALVYNTGVYIHLYFKHRRLTTRFSMRFAKSLLDQEQLMSEKCGISKQIEFYRKNVDEIRPLPKIVQFPH